MQFDKISDVDRSGKGNVGQPDTPNLNTLQMQTLMDSLPNLAIDKFNDFIDALNVALTDIITSGGDTNKIPTAKAVYDFWNSGLPEDQMTALLAQYFVDHPEAIPEGVDARIGDDTLETESQTLSGAVNEVFDRTKKITVTPKLYGAIGDGVHDDTDAINTALSENEVVYGDIGAKYFIKRTVVIPYGHSFDGRNCEFHVDDSFESTSRNNLPTKVAIWIEGREPIFGSEQAGINKFVKEFKVINDSSLSDFVGIYMGYKTALSGTGSKVNNSVYGYNISDIYVNKFNTAIYIAEVWMSNFTNIYTNDADLFGLKIYGQSVNNNFVNCHFANKLRQGICIDLSTSPNYQNRPEGNTFTNCVIVTANEGVKISNVLASAFIGCIIDLHGTSAVHAVASDNCSFSDCWFDSFNEEHSTDYSKSVVVLESTNDIKSVNFVNCTVKGSGGGHLVTAGMNRGDVFTNCEFAYTGVVVYNPTGKIRMNGCRLRTGTKFHSGGSTPISLNSLDATNNPVENDGINLTQHLEFVLKNTFTGTTNIELFEPKALSTYMLVFRFVSDQYNSRTSVTFISFNNGVTTALPTSIETPAYENTFAVTDGKLYVSTTAPYGFELTVYKLI